MPIRVVKDLDNTQEPKASYFGIRIEDSRGGISVSLFLPAGSFLDKQPKRIPKV